MVGMKKLRRGDHVAVDGGVTGLEGIPLKAVVGGILPDNGAVFLFDETVVVFLVVSRPGKGDGADGVAEPVGDDMVDKPAVVIAVELPQGEWQARADILEGGESPAMGLVEEGIQANPAGSDVGGGEAT
jgi:hypothetical protein